MPETLDDHKKQLRRHESLGRKWGFAGLILSIAACAAALGPLTGDSHGAPYSIAGMAGALLVAWKPTDKARRNRAAAATLRAAIANHEAGVPSWTLARVAETAREATDISNAGKDAKKAKSPKLKQA